MLNSLIWPSTRRGTRNRPRPFVPSAAPAGRAVIKKSEASATEQNHFSPRIRQPLPLGSALTALAPTSEPPCTSVKNAAHQRHRDPPFGAADVDRRSARQGAL